MVSRKRRTRSYAAPKPSVDNLLASRERMNRASAEFLKIDLETALTFVKVARQTRDEVRKKRNCMAARKAYETVMKLINKVDLNGQDARAVTLALNQLRSDLEGLGETLSRQSSSFPVRVSFLVSYASGSNSASRWKIVSRMSRALIASAVD